MSSTVAPCPVTAVYSLLREPSLALLWTHGYTFHVRSPSHAGNITWGATHGSRQPRASEGKKRGRGVSLGERPPARAGRFRFECSGSVIYVS